MNNYEPNLKRFWANLENCIDHIELKNNEIQCFIKQIVYAQGTKQEFVIVDKPGKCDYIIAEAKGRIVKKTNKLKKLRTKY
jgi:hypothetical protein